MRIWLHDASGNDPGWNAWCLDLIGLSTWAPTKAEVMSRLPIKVTEYCDWCKRHRIPTDGAANGIQVVEEVVGNEVLFSPDTCQCENTELDRTVELLSASRSDLISTVSSLPEGALDWDPPYCSFVPWASWRSIKQILAHIANTETHYYLPNIGCKPELAPAAPGDDWESYLPEQRRHTVRFLSELHGEANRARVRREAEDWSVRKVLRRLVRHELLHWKSISRIGREYTSHHS